MDVESAIEEIGFGFYQVKRISVFFLLQVADGCEVLLLGFLGTVLQGEWKINNIQTAYLTTSVFVGMLFGAIILGNLSDRFGRKYILYLSSFIVLYAAVHSVFSPTFTWLCFLRGLVGFGISGFLIISSILVAEISPRKYRACCQAVLFTGWGFGSILIVGIGALMIPSFGWRAFLLSAAVPVLIGTLGLPLVDESPRYLLSIGDKEGAMDVLKKMAAENKKEVPCKELKDVVISADERASSITTMFQRELGSAVFVTCFMGFVAGFIYYGAVFLSAKLPLVQFTCLEGHPQWQRPSYTDDSCYSEINKDFFLSLAIAASGDLFAGIIMTTVIDHCGRKPGMILCLTISTILFLLPVFCMPRRIQDLILLTLRCLTLTFTECTYVYTIEIFPTTIRSTAIGLCSLLKRIGGMITPFVGQVLVENNTKMALSLYAFVCVCSSILFLLLSEETSEYQLFESVNEFTDRTPKFSIIKNYGSADKEVSKKE